MANFGVSGTTQYEAMVQAALRHLSEATPDLDVEVIAEEAGVPREIALGFFPDGGALLVAAAENALVRLMDYLSTRSVHEGGRDPVAQYRAITLGYVDWAIQNPLAFAVLNNRSTFALSRDGAIGRYNRSMRELITALLVRAREGGRLRDGVDPEETVLTTRGLSHGLALLVVHNLARHWTTEEDTGAAARQIIIRYLDGLFLPAPEVPPAPEPAPKRKKR